MNTNKYITLTMAAMLVTSCSMFYRTVYQVPYQVKSKKGTPYFHLLPIVVSKNGYFGLTPLFPIIRTSSRENEQLKSSIRIEADSLLLQHCPELAINAINIIGKPNEIENVCSYKLEQLIEDENEYVITINGNRYAYKFYSSSQYVYSPFIYLD